MLPLMEYDWAPCNHLGSDWSRLAFVTSGASGSYATHGQFENWDTAEKFSRELVAHRAFMSVLFTEGETYPYEALPKSEYVA